MALQLLVLRHDEMGAVLVLGLLNVEFVLCHGTLQWGDLPRPVDQQLLACYIKQENTGLYPRDTVNKEQDLKRV